MLDNIEPLNDEDETRLQKHREWMIGHFDDPEAYDTVIGKLRLIQTIVDNGWIEQSETWKLQSLGVTFGDALAQEVAELFWVAVEDEHGRDPALRWLDTSTVAFPLTSISKRIENGEAVIVGDLFDGFQEAVQKSLENCRQE